MFPVNLEVIDNPRRILYSRQLRIGYPDKQVPQTSKFFGSCNRSAQVPGHPEVAYEFPAQSPQNVISKARSETRKSLSRFGLTENDGHVNEELAERIAVRRQESRRRYAPMGWIWSTGEDILWYGSPVERPWVKQIHAS